MILLLGGGGYVGSAFARKLQSQGVDYRSVSRSRIDYTQRSCLIGLIRETKPAFLINAAGYTGKPNVDACEDHKADCLLGNAVLPGIIREACEATDLHWGHVSSGCIYQGSRPDGSGFRESDLPNFSFRQPPCSFYSGCKALGEECLAGAENTFIWRLRIPFNEFDSQRNYLSKLMRYDRLLDVRNSITDLNEYVEACISCWQNRIQPGTYNVTNTGSIMTHEVVELIRRYRQPKREFRFFEDESEFMRDAVKTPRSSCVLDNSKLLATGVRMSAVEEAIERSLKNWVVDGTLPSDVC